MIVRPFGRTHLWAMLTGKVIAPDCWTGAAFKLVIISNRATDKNFATDTRYIVAVFGSVAPTINERRSLGGGRRLRPNHLHRRLASGWLFGRKRFHESLFKIINVL